MWRWLRQSWIPWCPLTPNRPKLQNHKTVRFIIIISIEIAIQERLIMDGSPVKVSTLPGNLRSWMNWLLSLIIIIRSRFQTWTNRIHKLSVVLLWRKVCINCNTHFEVHSCFYHMMSDCQFWRSIAHQQHKSLYLFLLTFLLNMLPTVVQNWIWIKTKSSFLGLSLWTYCILLQNCRFASQTNFFIDWPAGYKISLSLASDWFSGRYNRIPYPYDVYHFIACRRWRLSLK